ncbi:MAG: DUF1178 family protein [Mesorhizobium sp.]|nr:MAG: DUF1178 family protein [Mesorhizobium sp.]
MIRFSLVCEHEHEFEAWFRSNDDFDTQKKRGFVDCPACGSHKVDKALMAPAVSTSRTQEKVALAMGEAQKQALAQLKALADKAINIRAITTSEIKISILIDGPYTELAVRTLHSVYGLDKQ